MTGLLGSRLSQTEQLQPGHAAKGGLVQPWPEVGVRNNIPNRGDTGLPAGHQARFDRSVPLLSGLPSPECYHTFEPLRKGTQSSFRAWSADVGVGQVQVGMDIDQSRQNDHIAQVHIG
jgi:hypothetical protein